MLMTGALTALVGSLLVFLREVFLATAGVSIGDKQRIAPSPNGTRSDRAG